MRGGLWVVAGACLFARGAAAHIVEGLPDETPGAIHAAPDGVFVLDYGDRFVRWKEGMHEEVELTPPTPGFGASRRLLNVGADGTVFVVLAATGRLAGDRRVQRVWLMRCQESCEALQLFEGVQSDERSHTLALFAVGIDASGQAHVITEATLSEVTIDSEGKEHTTTTTEKRWYHGDGSFEVRDHVPLAARLLFDSQNRALVLDDGGGRLSAARLAPDRNVERVVRMEPARYNWDARLLANDELVVSYHDPSVEALTIARVDLDSAQVSTEILEMRESGIENLLFDHPDGLTVVTYFYRNAFYKGLKVVHDRSGDRQTVDLAASWERNIGWELRGAMGTDGAVLISYLDDVLRGKRVVRYFSSIDDLLASGQPPPTGWEAGPRTVFLVAGGGVMYAVWGVSAPTPSGVPSDRVFDVSYDLANSINTQALFEGQIGSVKIGASYFRSVVSNEIELAGGKTAARVFDAVTAVFGWDDSSDMQLRLEWGRMKGGLNVSGQPDEDRKINTERRAIELAYLNAYRVKVGIDLTLLDMPLPIYAFGVPTGDTAHRFLASGIQRASFYDLSLMAGYSLLDYTAKYEVNVMQPYVDVKVILGASFAVLDDPLPTPSPYDDPSMDLTFLVGGDIEVGFLVQLRSYSLHGLGLFVRGGLRARGTLRLDSGIPDDLDEPARSHETSLSLHRSEGFVGPYVQVGVVY